jgi:hypothetical protein
LKRFARYLICLLTLLHLCGGHLGVLQVVAWAQMIRTYSEERGLVEGVKDTFDGEHPCNLCNRIAEEKQSRQEKDPLTLVKIEAFAKWISLQPGVEVPAPDWKNPAPLIIPADPQNSAGQWSAAPPTPPPQAIA